MRRALYGSHADLPLYTCIRITGIIVLSPAFVTSKVPMMELHALLERHDEDPNGVSLIPVFLGLTWEQCKAVKDLYDAHECQMARRPVLNS